MLERDCTIRLAKNKGADHLCSYCKNKGADHLCGYCKNKGADHLCGYCKNKGADHLCSYCKNKGADHLCGYCKNKCADHLCSYCKNKDTDRLCGYCKNKSADHLCSYCKNKGADHLISYCTADLCHCFGICRLLIFWCSSSFSCTPDREIQRFTPCEKFLSHPRYLTPVAPCVQMFFFNTGCIGRYVILSLSAHVTMTSKRFKSKWRTPRFYHFST